MLFEWIQGQLVCLWTKNPKKPATVNKGNWYTFICMLKKSSVDTKNVHFLEYGSLGFLA